MAKSLDMLLSESSDFIESRINAGLNKTASATKNEGDDIFKLAEQLRAPATEEAHHEGSALASLTEKIANARAIAETFINLPLLQKIDSLEKTALAEGYSEEDFSSFIEKKASTLSFRSISELMPKS